MDVNLKLMLHRKQQRPMNIKKNITVKDEYTMSCGWILQPSKILTAKLQLQLADNANHMLRMDGNKYEMTLSVEFGS